MLYRTTSYAKDVWDTFWYEKNLQGDIVAVYNSSGTKLASYNYTDAWGNFTVSYSNGGASTGAAYNPFHYRGYYYDGDLGMYYLQSRYYDAKICRFISADGYVSTGQGLIGNNMFAYCGNNPVTGYDPTGMWTISFSLGFDITFSIVGISGNISIAFDDDGNIVIQTSYSEPFFVNDGETVHMGLFDAGIGGSAQFTLDDTVYDLEGPTTYVGTSAGTGLFYTGADAVFSGYNPTKEEFFKKPTGFQLMAGFGIGVDYHVKTTQTKTIYVIR